MCLVVVVVLMGRGVDVGGFDRIDKYKIQVVVECVRLVVFTYKPEQDDFHCTDYCTDNIVAVYVLFLVSTMLVRIFICE